MGFRGLRCIVFRVVFVVASLMLGESASANQHECPENARYIGSVTEGNVRTIRCECNAGYEKKNGDCKPIMGDPACVKQAGLKLNQDREVSCKQILGVCFQDNKTPLSAAALGCVAGCRRVDTCAVACGIAGLAAAGYVEKCIDKRNDCYEAALRQHTASVKACKEK